MIGFFTEEVGSQDEPLKDQPVKVQQKGENSVQSTLACVTSLEQPLGLFMLLS